MNDSSNKDKGFPDDNEEWTTECLIDELFYSLVTIKENIVNDKGHTIPIRKYYRLARDISKWIPISKPAPVFIIKISDLPERILKDFEQVKEDDARAYVLTQAVGRIFENLDFARYHLSIARNLRVGFER